MDGRGLSFGRIAAAWCAVAAPALVAATEARAYGFVLDFGANAVSSSTPPMGAAGTVEFTFIDFDTGVELLLAVTNTSAGGADQLQLTGFGFDQLDPAPFVIREFQFEDEDTQEGDGTELEFLLSNVDVGAFGVVDIAIADDMQFLDNDATEGLDPDQQDIVSFLLDTVLTASDLSMAFETAFFAPTGEEAPLNAVLHFESATEGASSETLQWRPPVTVIPLPAAGWMLLGAIGGLGVLGARRRRATA